MYDKFDEEIPKPIINHEYNPNEKAIISSDGLPHAFIDVNVTNVSETEGDKVEVTVTADAIIKIEKGDNLYNLAKKYDTTVEQLVEWNDIKDPDLIIEGRYLKVAETSTTEEFDKENSSVSVDSTEKSE